MYDQIKSDPEIQGIYQQIEAMEDATGGWAYHNFIHVQNVAEIVEKLLVQLEFPADFIEEAKIAALLHDAGALQGKAGHAIRGYEFAQNYFKRRNIHLKFEAQVLDAIKVHSDGFESHNVMALALMFGDKLDITRTRVALAGYEAKGMRQLQYIDDIEISISQQKLSVNFIHAREMDVGELESFYFMKKVFKAIQRFSCKAELDYEILRNNERWHPQWSE